MRLMTPHPAQVERWLARATEGPRADGARWGASAQDSYRALHPALRDRRLVRRGRLSEHTHELVRLLGERLGVSRAEQLLLRQSHLAALLRPPPAPNEDEESVFRRLRAWLTGVQPRP